MVLRVVAALSDSLFQSELVIAETQFVAAVPAARGLPILHDPGTGGAQHGSDDRARGWPGRLRLRRAIDRRTPGVVPPGREHVSVDVPGPGRARPAAGHAWAWRDSASQRPGATPRTGAAAGGGLRGPHARSDGRRGKRRADGCRHRDRNAQRPGRGRAGAVGPRDQPADWVDSGGAGRRLRRGSRSRRSSPPAPPRRARCWRR